VLTNLLREAGDAELHRAGYETAFRFLELAASEQDEAAWREFIDHHNGPGKWDALSDRARDRFMAQTAPTVDGFHSNIGDPTTLADCASIAVPTTILCSETAAPYDRRVTEILRDRIPGSQWVEIAGAGHMSPLTHPEAVAGLIGRHLSEQAALPVS
jgi:pimeloyl-ACP methyl ester carboxylesterase